jgi:hypothetical protein
MITKKIQGVKMITKSLLPFLSIMRFMSVAVKEKRESQKSESERIRDVWSAKAPVYWRFLIF